MTSTYESGGMIQPITGEEGSLAHVKRAQCPQERRVLLMKDKGGLGGPRAALGKEGGPVTLCVQ